jgi:peptidoglycan/LPS O-acetylase OafA/YrhL
LFNWIDYLGKHSIIGVEWSLSIEIFWYLLLPMLIKIISNKTKAICVLIISYLFYLIIVKFAYIIPLNNTDLSLAIHFNPIGYFFSYSCGVAAYVIKPTINRFKHNNDISFLLVLVIILLFSIKPELFTRYFINEYLLFSILTFILIIGLNNDSKLTKLFFSNRITVFIGVISYGLYLSHLPIINIINNINLLSTMNLFYKFVVVIFIGMIVSTILYIIIEIPCQKIGNKIINTL